MHSPTWRMRYDSFLITALKLPELTQKRNVQLIFGAQSIDSPPSVTAGSMTLWADNFSNSFFSKLSRRWSRAIVCGIIGLSVSV